MNKQSLAFLQFILVVLDVLMVNIAYAVARLLFAENGMTAYASDYFEFLIAINLCWLAASWMANIYRKDVMLSFEYFSRRTVMAYLYWFALLTTYLYFFRETNLSRLFIGATIMIYPAGLLTNRFLHIVLKKSLGKWFRDGGHIIIIGYNDTSKKLVSYLEQESIDPGILGFTENEGNITELTHYPVIGDIGSSVALSKKYNVDHIYSTITPEQEPQLYQLMQEAENECIRFKIVPDLSMFVKGRFHVSYYNDIPILTTRGESLDILTNRLKKRMLDITVSSLVIIFILSWLIPLISLLIMLESRGPIFFSQMRTGKNGQKFKCYKFRSMYVNELSEMKQATRNDARITKIGRFLRRTSLDEFPQFFNVLIGNMSIVGPRPHMLQHTSDYSKIVNQYMVRHFLKPGITGWAQINGYRGEIKEAIHIKTRVEYDIWYMENWSLILDIKIIFMTVFNIIRGEEKAY